jgi:hypothetical protein
MFLISSGLANLIPSQDDSESVLVVHIHMCIAEHDDEFVCDCACDVGNHVCEESIRGDIERDA